MATKYSALTERYFAERGIQVEMVRLDGSIELAPLVGLAERIVDLVQSGETLRANGLVEVAEILHVHRAADREPRGAEDRAPRASAALLDELRARGSARDPPSSETADLSRLDGVVAALRPRRTRPPIRGRRRAGGGDRRRGARGAATPRCSTSRSASTAWSCRAAELRVSEDECGGRDASPPRLRGRARRGGAPDRGASTATSCPRSWWMRDEHGSLLGQEVRPLDRVGVYVPGGRRPIPRPC